MEQENPSKSVFFKFKPLVLTSTQFFSQSLKEVSEIKEVDKIPLPGQIIFLFVSLEASIAAWSAIARFPPFPMNKILVD